MGANNLTLEEQLRQGLIAPGTPFSLKQTVEVSFQDSQVESLQESNRQLEIKLQEAANSNQKRILMVTVEGIHTGMTKNKTFYPGTTLESSVPTWTAPHHKPVLKNHNEYTEPLGRIVDAEYVESTLTDKYTVRLKLEITDQDAIDKILDKRYLTLSVGGSASKVVCSVCAKDLVAESYCGHRRGAKYEGKEAYWTIANYTGDEISFVNMPADVHAQVIACELVTGEGGKNVGNGKPKENAQTDPQTGATPVQESNGADVGSVIDNLLGGEPQAQTNENADPTPENPKVNENNDNPNNGNTDNPANPKESETDEQKIARLEQELKDANDQVSDLTAKVEEKENTLTTLTAELSEAKDNYETTKKHLESAENEKQTLVEQNVTLARFARKTMAERVADLRILQGRNTQDERESLIEEWSQSSSKILESQISELLSARREPVAIPPVGAAVVDKNNTGNNDQLVDGDGNNITTQKESAKSTEQKLPTMKEFESTMKRSIFRSN